MNYSRQSLKIVVVGAGSSTFGPPTLYDFISRLTDVDITLSLMDIDEESLELMHNAAEEIAGEFNGNVNVSSSSDRKEALDGADFVLITAEENRIEDWKRDWEIPQKYGITHTLGENRGPGGLSHTLRTVPLVMDICKDIEKVAPEAFTLILTNPEDRITWAISEYTELEVAGYCDGPWDFKDRYVRDLLDIPGERIHLEGAGINHAVWVTELKDKVTGEDLYPDLVKKAREEDWQPLGLHLYETYGYWPYENDEHYGEYLSYACDFVDCKGYDFEAYNEKRKNWHRKLVELKKGDHDSGSFLEDSKQAAQYKFGDAPPSKVVEGLFGSEGRFMPTSLNVPNGGSLPALPSDMIVEVPTVVSQGGVHGISCEEFPDPLNNFLFRQAVIQKLSARAPVERSRELAMKALIMDASVDSPDTANQLLDDFLRAHEESIPDLEK